MKTIAIGIALLTMTASALAGDGDRRTTTNGAIVWSTRNRDGDKFSLVFQFGNRTAVDVRYEQGPYGRYDRNDRYGRNDGGYRYDPYGRYDQYGQGGFRSCPPVYNYSRYRGHDYDSRYFSCYEEWADWRQWQKHWSKKKNWVRNDRERSRAWQAFQYERNRAYSEWERNHDGRNDYDRDRRDDRDDRDRRDRDDRRGH